MPPPSATVPVRVHARRRARPFWRTASLALLVTAAASAQEVQHHGLVFEEWIRTTFFDGYQPARTTQKWDIPAAANRRHGGLPVNPKAARYGTALGLGDALRQFDIDEPFILVAGFWRQEGPTKRFVNVTAVTIHPETWRLLWGPVTRADLERLDALIKDRSLDYREARRRAHALNATPPFSEALITLNPKIDSKTQRRLQCSLRFDHFFDLLAGDADRDESDIPSLWGVPLPGGLTSAPRAFAP